ncbi:hypothetical protein [Actinoplanes sp. NPDC048796]|uniref:hypothetical protein n=1 Tax=unclassified Actinoplanes TaxID=2626549 RepID=UPI0033F8BCBD
MATTLLLALLTACGNDSPSRPAGEIVTFSCCAEDDVDRPYRPGDTLTLHWTAQTQEGTPDDSPVELNVRVVGPFGSVTELKSSPSGSPSSVTFDAPPVRPSGSSAAKPVSKVVIPADAGPGYYNVSYSEKRGGTVVGGASIIRVVAATG